MRPLIIAAALLPLAACQSATAVQERVRSAASAAITVADTVCPFVAMVPEQAPEVAKACAALEPMLPVLRALVTPGR